MTRLHATAIAARCGCAALLTGPSGAGKSDLALRMIDRGWMLIADDGVETAAADGHLIASAPPSIAGLIECRGVGILRLPHLHQARVALVVRLGPEPERLPEPASEAIEAVSMPAVTLNPWTISAALRLEHAFARAHVSLECGAAT